MQVYQFEKTLLERLNDCLNVLSWKEIHISASQVKSQWSSFIELQIEPSGWEAVWKIPRNVCEIYKVRYPSIVFGYVEHVNFQDLNAIYKITAVQDENVHLPEHHEAALEDLFPTINQENTALNIEQTADCIDRLRFFYSHIWLPWDNDNDDDFNWVETHLHPRIKLCFDLRQRNINRPVASLIRSFIDEAKFIQRKREYIEKDMLNDESSKCTDELMAKPRLKQLMLMHLRLTEIQSHFEMLENPFMRSIYEEFKFSKSNNSKFCPTQNEEKSTEPAYCVVMLPCPIAQQIEFLKAAEKIIQKNVPISYSYSLQDVLNTYTPGDKILLSTGSHVLYFTEHFLIRGQVSGVKCRNKEKESDLENCVRIYSSVNNSSLFIFDEDFTLENIELDCQNVLAGLVVKHGVLTIRNCKLFGNGKSTIQQGIICKAYASIHMENCVLDSFATGIFLGEGSSLTLQDSVITNCNVGMEVSKNSNLKCSKSYISNCISYGIYVIGLSIAADEKYLTLEHFKDLEKHSTERLQVSGDCLFENCSSSICIVNDKNCVISYKTINYMDNF